MVIVDSVSEGDLSPVTPAIDNTTGVTKMNWFSATGKTGNFVFAYVTLKAVSSAGQSCSLDLEVKELTDASANTIPRTVRDGVFEISPITIEVSPSIETLYVSETQQFTATVKDQNGDPISGINITWKSSNTTVGTVSPVSATTGTNGTATTTFTALVGGKTTIKASSETTSGKADVTVLNTNHAMCREVDQFGNPINLTTDFSTSDTCAVSWVKLVNISGLNPDQTTWKWILPNGSLYPSSFMSKKWCEIKGGIAQVCTFAAYLNIAGEAPANISGNWHVDFYYDNEKQFTESFTIATDSVLTQIEVTPSTKELYVSETQQFTATLKDQNGENPMAGINITWTSSNTATGTVSPASAITGSDGKATTTFTASASGTTTVKASYGDVSGTASVTVQKKEETSSAKRGGGGGGGSSGPPDMDGDGMSNLEEKTAGTDLNDPCDPNPDCIACLAKRGLTPTPEAKKPTAAVPAAMPTATETPTATPTLEPTATPTSTPKQPGFDAVFAAIAGLLAIAYLKLRRKRK